MGLKPRPSRRLFDKLFLRGKVFKLSKNIMTPTLKRDLFLSRQEIAEFLGVTVRTIDNWIAAGSIECDQGRSSISLRSATAFHISKLRGKNPRNTETTLKNRKLKAEAEGAEIDTELKKIKLEEAQEKLVSVEVFDQFQERLINLRSSLLLLPAKLAHELSENNRANEIIAILEQAIKECLIKASGNNEKG